MNYRDTMAELKKMGTAQTRKVYGRHGVSEAMFGVSYGNLGKLKKKIKVNHSLALQLWASGYHDARVLAAMVADPAALDNKTVEAWVKDLENYIVTDAFSGLVKRSPLAQSKLSKWTKSKQEWVGCAGWQLVAGVAAADNELPDAYFESYLTMIEAGIHKSKNRVRYSMITAVINIGLRSPALEKKAIAVAKRIGHVDVDHGDTSCKTPDAIEYIAKTKAHREKKGEKVTMGRMILGIVAGYLVMFVWVMATSFLAARLIGSENVTATWLAVTLALSFVGAYLGGSFALRLGSDRGPAAVRGLAILVLFLGLGSAVAGLKDSAPSALAEFPTWHNFIVPFIGAAGAMLGGRRRTSE